MAITILILYNIYRQLDRNSLKQKLFLALLYCNAAILILDSVLVMLGGTQCRTLTCVLMTVYYFLNPVFCTLWCLYVDYSIFRTVSHIKKTLMPLLIPLLLLLVLSVVSNFSDILFYIDEANMYRRGKFFAVLPILCVAYIVFSTVLAIRNRKLLNNRDYVPMTMFAVPPLIGGAVQCTMNGIPLIWACTTFSVLIAFVNIQNSALYKDYLTSLYNRRHLDQYLRTQTQDTDSKLLAGMMIDIDSFKQINDLYGHKSGDQALKLTSEILRKSFGRKDFLARYGGDEFIVFMEIREREDLNNAVERLRANLASFNAQKLVPYELSFSMGYDYYSGGSVVKFLDHIDSLMYAEKQKHAELARNTAGKAQAL